MPILRKWLKKHLNDCSGVVVQVAMLRHLSDYWGS